MLPQLLTVSLTLAGILTVVVVLVAGTVIGLLKGHSAFTLASLAPVVSPPVAVGVASATVLATTIADASTALAVLITAIFFGLVNLYTARTARMVAIKEIAKAVAPVEAKIDALTPVVAKIDTHVNGEKTRAEGELAAKELQITLQRELIEEMKRATALLAQAKATADVTAAAVAAATATPATATIMSESAPAKSLEQIDKNTAETANNTARTEAVVQDLKDKA